MTEPQACDPADILLVEDNPGDIRLTEEAFEEGQTANTLHIVIEELNDDPELGRIPVIILTSSEAEEDVVTSYDLRANVYLTKLVDPAAFIEIVQTLEAFWLSVVRLPPCDNDRS